MNLEEELRAVLSQEAEMRTTPTPDIEDIVNGGESRLRRRNTMRIGGLAAAAVLLVGGVYGVMQLGDDDDPDAGVANQPSESAEAAIPVYWPENESTVEAGTYRTFVGLSGAGATIEADFTTDGEGWQGSNHPVAFAGNAFAGLGVYQPESVAGGCRMGAGLKDAATTSQQLVQQLIRMPRSEVVQQPAPTEAFGGSAVHLQLRIDAFCDGGAAYQVAEAPAGGRGISYYDERPRGDGDVVIIDFWVVDVDGTPVVVDRFHREDAPDDLVAQSTRAVESITFVEAE
jgi:hypothetical protein